MKAVICPLIDRPCEDERCVESKCCYYQGNGCGDVIQTTTEMPARDKQSCMSNYLGEKQA